MTSKQYFQPLFDRYQANPGNYNLFLHHSPSNGVYGVHIAPLGSDEETDDEFWHMPLSNLSAKDFQHLVDQVAADYSTFDQDVLTLFGESIDVLGHETRQCFGYKANPHGLDPYLKYFDVPKNAKKIQHIKKILREGTPDD